MPISYILTIHARARMKERDISKRLIKEALEKPTKTGYDNKGRRMIKKLYERGNKERLLIIVGEATNTQFKIITIIDTSKVKKYL